jgi:nicotinamidase/pyrazinamidase
MNEQGHPNALIITDVQIDFCPGGALPVPEGDRIVPLVNRLQPCFDLVVATQDWHPADHRSFAANHPGRRVGDRITLAGLPQILWPVHCVQHSIGADFHPDLDQRRVSQVIRKGLDRDIDSYSGFFDNGRRRATALEEYLRLQRAGDLYLCGLTTDYCVKYTALDAAQLGFRVFLVEDACRGVDLHPGDVAGAIDQMRAAGVKVIRSAQVLSGGRR